MAAKLISTHCWDVSDSGACFSDVSLWNRLRGGLNPSVHSECTSHNLDLLFSIRDAVHEPESYRLMSKRCFIDIYTQIYTYIYI